MSKLSSSMAVVAIMVGLTACSDDSITGVTSGDPLTAEEIQQVFGAFFGAVDDVPVGFPAAAPGPAAVSVSQDFSVSPPCDGGGTMTVAGGLSGDIDEVTGAFDVSVGVTINPDACVVPTTSGSLTLDGAPLIQFTLNFAGSDEQGSMSGSYTGGISFTASDGRSGSCAFDVQYSFTYSPSTVTGSASGSVCGISASEFEVIEI